jgi:hypothetical protein
MADDADLVDHTLDREPARCVECGAALTAAEQQRVLDDGLPPLCTVHAAEDEAALVDDADDAA